LISIDNLKKAVPGLRNRSASVMTLSLGSPEELFDVSGTSMFSPGARFQSGIDELLERVAASPGNANLNLIVKIPSDAAAGVLAGDIEAAIRRYCEQRLVQNASLLKAQRRNGLTAIPLGAVLFLGGLGLSASLTGSATPGPIRFVLGDAAFLVVAWVGLWYPLDALLFYSRPLRKERRVLQIVSKITVELELS
jgi:hypothetical protein